MFRRLLQTKQLELVPAVEQHQRHLMSAEAVLARTKDGVARRKKRYTELRKFSQTTLTDRFRE